MLLLVSSLSCARFAPAPRSLEDAHPAASFTLYEDTMPAPDEWWSDFGAEELDTLMANALADNLNLQQIAARLTQAEMLAQQAGAARFPELDATGDASLTRRQSTRETSSDSLSDTNQQLSALNTLLGGTTGGSTPTTSSANEFRTAQSRLQAAQSLLEDPPDARVTTVSRSYKFGLASRYEVDLWGRVHARHQAALLDLEASREDMHAAMLSLTGAVARQWLVIVARRQELRVVREQMALNKTVLELMELRFRNGLATALDVFQQRQITAQTESLIPALEEAMQGATLELAALLGRNPGDATPVTTESLPGTGALPAPGLPCDLLARRPDVRAAGLQLQAADWRVSAAQADRLPALRLTGAASFGAEDLSVLFDNWMATLAASVTGPIFDAGRRKAEVARTRAVVDERLAAYRRAALESVKEVELAMMRETKQVEYITSLNRERDTAQATYEQALQRYQNGIIDYLPVLSALTQKQIIERKIVQAEQTRLERRVLLHIALGGGWMDGRSGRPED